MTAGIELNTQEIYQRLLNQERVTLECVFSSAEKEEQHGTFVQFRLECNRILNHLQVIKSRDKKVYTGLGMDWKVGVIRLDLELVDNPEQYGYRATFYIGQSKRPKRSFQVMIHKP